MTAWLLLLVSIIAGGAWRRWEGMQMTGFFAHRWLKLTVAALFGFGLAAYWTRDLFAAAFVSAVITAGWTRPAQVGRLETRVPWSLIPRYGVVTLLAAIGAALILRDWHVLWYAPVGALAPLGYMGGKIWNVNGCWTCVGECWLGAIMFGGLGLLSIF